ncbi:MAG: isopenicillin N synthase family dioxygenase [Gammaproteobacteria bacterium]|jgi:isopenicillin N synthase-like dioxygenase|tara:strand:- start:81 stop:980 length:900 start_codon:yes stop_codon:yes gene_type:complete
MSSEIPKLSLNNLVNNDKASIKLLSSALSNHGFFIITDHDIPHSLFDSAYEYSKKFFDLDLKTKNLYSFRENAGARGYTPFGKETALGETVPDLKEFWHHGPVIDDTYDERIMKNVYVNEIEGFNNVFDDLFNEMNNLGGQLLSSICLTLGLDSNFFDNSTSKGNSLLRLIHYPPSNNENIFRAREHADINLITLLIGANEPGLEVNDKSGKWIPVSSSYEDIVCNIGDMMQLITDHNLKSTPHRVVKYKTDEIKSRYSIPFFMHPSPGTILKSVFNDNDSGVLAHDFLDERLRAIKLY